MPLLSEKTSQINKKAEKMNKEAEKVRDVLKKEGLETRLSDKVLDAKTRKKRIEKRMKEIMQLLNLNLNDDSLAETPNRIAKMYVDEIFSGLDYANFPKITLIENKMKINENILL